MRGAVVLTILFLVAPTAAAAQSFLSTPSVQGGVQVSMVPSHPQPGETVHLTAASSFMNLSRSSIVWSAGGKTIASGFGVREVDVVAGPAGSLITVTVTATDEDGASASGSARIRPSEIDLLWSADTFTPAFYSGKAMPSAGSSVSVQAIPRFVTGNGTLVADRDIVFTWRKNGAVVGSVSGRGKSSAMFPAPTLHGTDTISVEAVSNDASFEGSAELRIPSVEPQIVLYERHPIFGTMLHRAITAQSSNSNSEATFTAVPYFAHALAANDPQLRYSWLVNGNRIPANALLPQEITINADNSSGIANIRLTVTHLRNWLLKSSGEWSISFGSGGTSGNDPFRFGTD